MTCEPDQRLGAVVHAYDVRPAVREQVESLGGKFVELKLETADAEDKGGYATAMGEEFYVKQRQLMAEVVAESDVVITTAAIPGKTAPLLITADAVAGMAPGSVIVDLAAERGGNCELSQADQRVVDHGVVILGPSNLPAEIPYHASQMYSNNVTKFLLNLVKDGEVVTACQSACPTQAIVFGDLNDPNSKVTQAKNRSLDYVLLEEVNARPRTSYLASVFNPNPKLVPTEQNESAP